MCRYELQYNGTEYIYRKVSQFYLMHVCNKQHLKQVLTLAL